MGVVGSGNGWNLGLFVVLAEGFAVVGVEEGGRAGGLYREGTVECGDGECDILGVRGGLLELPGGMRSEREIGVEFRGCEFVGDVLEVGARVVEGGGEVGDGEEE